jgi:hypothetical protein
MAQTLHNIIVFFTNNKIAKFHNANTTNLRSLRHWAERKGNVAYYNIYDKKTRQFVEQIFISDVYAITIFFNAASKAIKKQNVYFLQQELDYAKQAGAIGVNVYNKKTKQQQTLNF